jgi:subtilisin-like proprotein convertase family protein
MDRSDYDGYASSRHVLAIGAVDHNGKQAYYSEPGACLFAVAPSSGNSKGITTTDLMGSYGYSQTECTNSFGGTSSAAPLAAGIFAVLLEVKPGLGLRDLQHLIYRARTTNSHELGFGVLNLPQLIEEAKKHTKLPDAKEYWTDKRSTDGIFKIPVQMDFIERVMLTISMTHGRRGQISISLKSSKFTSIFSELHNDQHRGGFTWTYHSVRSFGELNKKNQEWEVIVKDMVPNDNYVGNIDSIQLGFVYY